MPLPDRHYLRRGHIIAHLGLSPGDFDDLVAAGIFTPHDLPVPAPEKLPAWRRRRLPDTKRAVYLRSEITAALAAGRIAAPKS